MAFHQFIVRQLGDSSIRSASYRSTPRYRIRPTQEWKQAGACPVSRRGKQRMHFSDLPVNQLKYVFLYGQADDTRPPRTALLLIDQHDAVFAPFVESTGRARRHAAGIQAVVADPRQVEEDQTVRQLSCKRCCSVRPSRFGSFSA